MAVTSSGGSGQLGGQETDDQGRVLVPDEPAKPPSGGGGGGGGGGGRLSAEQIAQAAYDAGFRGDALATAVAIALAESSGNAGALNPNGEHSVGLWQINMNAHGDRFGSEQQLYDPLTNAKAAFALSQGGKRWTPWTTFTGATTSGANNPHTRHMDAARAAAAKVEGGQAFDYTVEGGGGDGSVQAAGLSVPQIAGAAQMPDEELKASLRRDFGYLAWALEIPEVGDILLQAARGELSGDRLVGAITGTDWWKTTSQSMRQWDKLAGEDPGEATRRVNLAMTELKLSSDRLGANVPEERLRQLVEQSLRMGWSETELRHALLAEAEFDPTAGQATGFAASVTDLVSIARDEYLVPMSRTAAAKWSQKLLAGTVTEDGFREHLAGVSASRFPAFAEQIAAGVTPDALFDSYRGLAAETLEMDADHIDLLNDPKFSKALQVRDEKGQLRPMTLSEWQTHLRKLPEWRKTRNAQQAASGVVQALGQVFGQV